MYSNHALHVTSTLSASGDEEAEVDGEGEEGAAGQQQLQGEERPSRKILGASLDSSADGKAADGTGGEGEVVTEESYLFPANALAFEDEGGQQAGVLEADIKAGASWVHVIDKVLVPQVRRGW